MLVTENLYQWYMGHGSSVLNASLVNVIEELDVRDKTKIGYSCYDKKMHGFENPNEKFKRWRRNLKFAYQRIKYGYCDSDVWSIDVWFLNVMPGMLQQLKDTTHSYPCFPGSISHAVCETGMSEDAANEGVKHWEDILSEMIFLLNEANEDTCTRENKYQKEYEKAHEEFDNKYGFWGEKLRTEEEKTEEKEKGIYRAYMPGDVPEYKEISELYFNEYRALSDYRDECKNKALELFSKWFWDLWD